MSNMPVIVWFRHDLRLSDNPALAEAAKYGPVIPVFILDDTLHWQPGAANKWWLHYSLQTLRENLNKKYGAILRTFKGDPKTILPKLVKQTDAKHVFWNRYYHPESIERDNAIKADLEDGDIEVHISNGCLLKEPWEIQNKQGSNFKVYTPFWKELQKHDMRQPLDAPHQLTPYTKDITDDGLNALNLLPTINWDSEMQKEWQPGEDGAEKRLTTFLDYGLNGYKEGRNRPDLPNVSRLSPHLQWGDISPVQIWHRTKAREETNRAPEKDVHHFLSELAWREFSYSLLYYYPDLTHEPLQKKFKHYPWEQNTEALERWQKGQTGYPIVDAGMRELWQTGYMHNRLRMIVGSFLIKDLRIHWIKGEKWFWDTLCDADIANNSASWQWIAGCGADAAPYFRIFNPITQGRKFDPNGDYVRKYVPELAKLSNSDLHAPWEADKQALLDAGVILGKTYPEPMVDHKTARQKALEGYEQVKKNK